MDSSQQAQDFYVYVDVDDTLVRSYSTKRMPMVRSIEHVKALKQQGAILYCWSTGGAEYARKSAEELGIADLFAAFLPKPNMLLDDQDIAQWRYLLQVHPMSIGSNNLEDYRKQCDRKEDSMQSPYPGLKDYF